ncbi:MAG: hypothetical protein ABI239_14365 [Aquihabitans sp.]
MSIAAYTLSDSHGARLSASGVSYGIALTVGVAIAVSAAGIVQGQGSALVSAG